MPQSSAPAPFRKNGTFRWGRSRWNCLASLVSSFSGMGSPGLILTSLPLPVRVEEYPISPYTSDAMGGQESPPAGTPDENDARPNVGDVQSVLLAVTRVFRDRR